MTGKRLVPPEPTLDHSETAWRDYQAFLDNRGPIVIGAVQGASCYGPAYEFAMIVDAELMHITEVDDDSEDRRSQALPFQFSMVLPAFRGLPAVANTERLCNSPAV